MLNIFVYCVGKQVVLTVLAVMQYQKGVSIGFLHGSGPDSYTDSGSAPF